MRAVDAINVLKYFAVVTLLFLLLAKHISVALPYVSNLLTSVCKHVNDSSATHKRFIRYTTPHPNR